MNARITERSFNKWQIFPSFAKQVFGNISLALPQNLETLKYLKFLKIKNIKSAGNLKYYGQKNNQKNESKLLKHKFKNHKAWCAASTHNNEEILIGKLHNKLKKREKKLVTIIIPRHINRTNEIIDSLNNLDLNCITHSSNQKLKKDTDVYLVDSYGESSKFYNLTKVCFVGGSIIKHGGQNPLEPARLGNYIINGPNVKNFKEIYAFLNHLKISSSSSNILKMENIILKKLKNKIPNKNIKKIISIGNDVLEKNLFYINKYLI
jgi:3-deoxy-D-manno-octulosonic-acid transferase